MNNTIKTVYGLIVVFFLSIIISSIFFLPDYEAVAVKDLKLTVDTIQPEYKIGQVIIFNAYLANNHPYKVKVTLPDNLTHYQVPVNHMGSVVCGTKKVEDGNQTVIIDPYSEQYFGTFSYGPQRRTGRFELYIGCEKLSKTLIVNITDTGLTEELEEVSYMFISYIFFEDLTQMYERSEIVIHGVVEVSDVDATFFSNLHTRYTININEVLKGPPMDSMVVTQDGGVYDGKIYRAKDEPLMKVGEEVVLYLGYNPSAESYQIMGGPQGRFYIKHGKLYHITELDKSIQFVTPALHTKGADASNLRQILTP